MRPRGRAAVHNARMETELVYMVGQSFLFLAGVFAFTWSYMIARYIATKHSAANKSKSDLKRNLTAANKSKLRPQTASKVDGCKYVEIATGLRVCRLTFQSQMSTTA